MHFGFHAAGQPLSQRQLRSLRRPLRFSAGAGFGAPADAARRGRRQRVAGQRRVGPGQLRLHFPGGLKLSSCLGKRSCAALRTSKHV